MTRLREYGQEVGGGEEARTEMGARSPDEGHQPVGGRRAEVVGHEAEGQGPDVVGLCVGGQ